MANASGDHQTMSKFEKKYLFYYHYSAALVIALLLFSETRSQPSGDYAVQAKLRNMYEEALVNSNESLYILQRMYFNPSPRSKYRSSFCLRVNVTIDNPPPLDQQYKCNATFVDGHFISQYVLHLLSDDGYTSRLADLLSYTRTDVFFYTFDPTFYATMQALAISIDTDTSNVVVYDSSRDNSIKIDISGEFEHMPCRDDAVDAMKMILMWAKAYARTGAIPLHKQEEDRCSVSNFSDTYCSGYQDTSPIDPNWTSVLLVSMFASSYLLVLSLASLSIQKVFLWLQQQGKLTKLLYKASAVVLTFVNVITLVLDIYFSIKYVVSGLSVLAYKVMLIVFIELPLVCLGTYERDQNDIKRYKLLHAFALWQIICFIHRLVIDIIISVVLIIISPAQTLGVVTLLLSIIASAIAFVAIIINRGCASCRTSCKFMFCAAFNGILITGSLLTITLLFIIFVDNGLKSAGMGGLILSLIPPFVIFVIGFFVNKNDVISAVLGGEQPVAPAVPGEEQTEDTSTNGDLDDQLHMQQSERQPLLASPHGHP